MRIEGIEPAKRPRDCYIVSLEKGISITVTQEEILAFGLGLGRDLTEEVWPELEAAAQRSVARRWAVQLLSVRDMSRRELLDKLEDHGVLRAAAEAAADRMEELDILREAQYAQNLVRRCAAKGWGAARAREELYRRGVRRETWEEALATVSDWEAVAADFLASRLRGRVLDPEEKKRQAAALSRRGFSWEIIRRVLEVREESH